MVLRKVTGKLTTLTKTRSVAWNPLTCASEDRGYSLTILQPKETRLATVEALRQ